MSPTYDIGRAEFRFQQEIEGRVFRRRGGEALFRAESLSHDTSLLRQYGFAHSYVRMRRMAVPSQYTRIASLVEFDIGEWVEEIL